MINYLGFAGLFTMTPVGHLRAFLFVHALAAGVDALNRTQHDAKRDCRSGPQDRMTSEAEIPVGVS